MSLSSWIPDTFHVSISRSIFSPENNANLLKERAFSFRFQNFNRLQYLFVPVSFHAKKRNLINNSHCQLNWNWTEDSNSIYTLIIQWLGRIFKTTSTNIEIMWMEMKVSKSNKREFKSFTILTISFSSSITNLQNLKTYVYINDIALQTKIQI